jgi:hypothetical protein
VVSDKGVNSLWSGLIEGKQMVVNDKGVNILWSEVIMRTVGGQ